MKTAIIIGATGLIGSNLLKLLLQDKQYIKVVAFTRRPLSDHPKLTQYLIDFENLDQYSDLIQGDEMFCCLGTTMKKAISKENFIKVDFEYPLHFAQIGLMNGIKQFLMVSSIGAEVKSSSFYLKVKGGCEAAIRDLNIPSISFFRPSVLMGGRQEFRLGEKVILFFMTPFSGLIPKKYRPIKAKQVAKAMLHVATKEKEGCEIYESDKIASL